MSFSLDFTVVILNEHVASYPHMHWREWKDHVRNQMISQGDHWSMTTLSGENIWDCLDSNHVDRLHGVQWNPTEDAIYKVSLPIKDC